MNKRQRQTLNNMLIALMGAQDNVTHMNEKGPQFKEETRELIREREKIKRKVIFFCDVELSND